MIPSSQFALGVGLLGGAHAFQYGYNHPPYIGDSDAVSRHFPDVEGIEILSPHFIWNNTQPGFNNGTQVPTSLDDLEKFIRGLANRNDWMTYHEPDFVSAEGRKFPYLTLSKGGNCAASKKVRIWIQGCQHGDEAGGDETVMALLGALDANQTWAEELLENLHLTVLPRYNVDGAFYLQRNLADNVDPNRDHITLHEQQTVDVRRMVNKYDPHVYIDLHEYTATSILGGKYLQSADGLFAGGTHPLIHRAIRNLTDGVFMDNYARAMEAHDLRWIPFALTDGEIDGRIALREAFAEAKVGRNAGGLRQALSFLHETRGIRLAAEHFQRRIATALVLVSSLVQTSSDNAELVKAAVEQAAREIAESEDDIIISWSETVVDRNYTFIDKDDGSLVDVPVKVRTTHQLEANFTRPRPEAYIIPRPWAHVAEKLDILGVEVETLEQPWTGIVESMNVTELAYNNQGAVIQGSVKTQTSLREVTVPAGSWRVDTAQRFAALAFVTLEPETVDSYVTQRIIQVRPNDEYPIFRIPASR